MKLRLSYKEVAFFICSLVVMSNRVAGINVNVNLRHGISLLWVLYFILHVVCRKRIRKDLSKHFKLMIFPFLCFFVYTIILWLFTGAASFSNFTRLCSTIIWLSLAYGYACSGYYFFSKKSIDILFWAGVVSYFFGSICYLIVSLGFAGLIEYIKILFTGATASSSISYVMEVHELTFTMGIFFLYYLFFGEEKDKHRKLKAVIAAILVFLGLKRIELLSLVVVGVAYLLIIRKGKNIGYRAGLVTAGFMTVLFGYVFLIQTGALSLLAARFNINFMGRLEAYNFARKFFSMDVFYPGLGYTFFSKMYEGLYNSGFRLNGYGVAASLHSDILCTYIEVGLVMFFLWILYSFYIKTKKLGKGGAYKVAECYMLLTIFMFILYLTDNTMTYYTTQMVYFIAPLILERSETR